MMADTFSIDEYIPKKDILDVRTLLAINFLSSLLVFSGSTILTVTIFCISFTVMLIFRLPKTALKYTVAFFVCYMISAAAVFACNTLKLGGFISVVDFFGFMAAKMIPLFMIAHTIIKKVNSDVLVYALRKLGLNKGFVLALTVSLRFIPTARHELPLIKDCMKMRGVEVTVKQFFKNPAIIIEYSLVPLLFRGLKISEEMTAAALVKGVEYGGKKTSLINVQLTVFDALFFCISLFLMLAVFIYSAPLEKMLHENITAVFHLFCANRGVL